MIYVLVDYSDKIKQVLKPLKANLDVFYIFGFVGTKYRRLKSYLYKSIGIKVSKV